MADSSVKTNNKEQVVKQMITVQIVHYHCANCGDEIEEVKLCTSCKAPMRVIQVTEKYGAEAEKFLEELKKQPNAVLKTDSGLDDNVSKSGVENAFADEDELKHIDEIDTGYTPIEAKSEDEMMAELIGDDGIFAGGDDEAPVPKSKDLEDILEGLDSDDNSGIDPSADFGGDDLESFRDL